MLKINNKLNSIFSHWPLFIIVYFIVFISFGIYSISLFGINYSLLFTICLGTIIFFGIFTGINLVNINNIIKNNKYQIILILLILITNFPLFTESYLFYDDYWAFSEKGNGIISGLKLARLFHGMLIEYFNFAFPANMNIVRIYTIFMIIIYAIVIYSWINKHSKKETLSFIITCFIVLSSQIIDCVAYAAALSYSTGLAAAVISVVLFEKAFVIWKEKKIKSVILCISSFLLIFTAFQCYQISLTIIFFMFAVYAYYTDDRKSLIKIFFIYILLFIISVSVSYLFINLFNTDSNINKRSSIITSYNEYINKIKWFFSYIIPNAVNRILAAVFGKILFLDKNYWYVLSYSNMPIKIMNIIKIFSYMFIIIGILTYYIKKKKLLEMLFMFLCIPGTYIVNILIIEYSYHTYYAYPLISLLLFYLIIGIHYILNIIIKNNVKINNIIFSLLIIICIIQTNLYIRKFWISENQKSYDYIKDTLNTSYIRNQLNWIHVYGTPNYGQADIYSIFAVKTILDEYGYNKDDFKITVSNNEYYIHNIHGSVLRELILSLASEEKEELMTCYDYNELYDNYTINSQGNILKENLQRIFNSNGYLPSNDDNNVLFIDLRWVSPIWGRNIYYEQNQYKIPKNLIFIDYIRISKDINILYDSSYDIHHIDIIEDNLLLNCGNIDPMINIPLINPIDKPEGNQYIELTYCSNISGLIQIFYDYGNGLSEKNSFRMEINQEENEENINIPVIGWNKNKKLFSIRIDPPNDAEIKIKNIKLLSTK